MLQCLVLTLFRINSVILYMKAYVLQFIMDWLPRELSRANPAESRAKNLQPFSFKVFLEPQAVFPVKILKLLLLLLGSWGLIKFNKKFL